MNKYRNVNDKWIKASIIGTIWAASEIVLGSFLHNLKIPFSGNILTAIGIIILVSASYVWSDKGLFWRAGLICAVMKTMSPSAVVFGPMIAIFAESLLLEASVFLFGKNIGGYMLGAMLAMSWNLFQKIINYIIFYGTDIVKMYKDIAIYAQKQFNTQFDLVWTPLIFLIVIYCILGAIAALVAIRTGRSITRQTLYPDITNTEEKVTYVNKKTKDEFNYSVPWLIFDVILIVSMLFILKHPWYYWTPAIIASSVIWILRYKRSMRQLMKIKFWLFFVVITMIVAFIVTKIQSGSLIQGLITGLEMNFRAIVIILGFSALGTELYNPVIRTFFAKTTFKQLPLALELSFEILPSMLKFLPDVKTVLKSPIQVFTKVISQINIRLSEIKKKTKNKIFIVSGPIGSGKTSCIITLVDMLKKQSIKAGGIYSKRVVENNVTIGYDVVDFNTNNTSPFLRITEDDSLSKIGKYSILPNGLTFGNETILKSINYSPDIIIIDEVGMLEIENKGWTKSIDEIINITDINIIITVRECFLDRVIHKWDLNESQVFKVTNNNYLKTVEKILSGCNVLT